MFCLEQKIKFFILQITKKLGYEILEIKILKNFIYKITVFIDSKHGINIKNCVNVTKHINIVLQKNININYDLEVSSPGPKRPLLNISHYKRFIGRTVRLILKIPVNNSLIYKGLIKSVQGNAITITSNNRSHLLVLSNIKKANLVSLL